MEPQCASGNAGFCCPLATSHKITLWSGVAAQANVLPSGESVNAFCDTAHVTSICPWLTPNGSQYAGMVRVGLPEATSQTMRLFACRETAMRLSRDNPNTQSPETGASPKKLRILIRPVRLKLRSSATGVTACGPTLW